MIRCHHVRGPVSVVYDFDTFNRFEIFSPIVGTISTSGIESAVHPPSRPPIRPTKPHQTPRPIPLFPVASATTVTTAPTNLPGLLTTEFVPVSSPVVDLSVNHSNNFFGSSTTGGTIDTNFIQDDEGKRSQYVNEYTNYINRMCACARVYVEKR